jgi:NTE family protein
MANETTGLALVLSGGGALAAYQVGFLRCIAKNFPSLRFHIMTGVSSGAINAAFLANSTANFSEAVDELIEIWRNLTIEQVFRVDTLNMVGHFVSWGASLVSGGIPKTYAKRGLVDTAPLRRFLKNVYQTKDGILGGIERNLQKGNLKACAITGTNYATGQSVTWVQGKDIKLWERPLRRSLKTEIAVDHIMASAALPLFFPAVQVGNHWYGDGGIRQFAPLSPAVHLGADRILAISTRYRQSMAEADAPVTQGYPPPVQIIGTLMNAVFLDVLEQDASSLYQINNLLDQIPVENRSAEPRRIKLFVLRPSIDLSTLAGKFEPNLPPMFRFLTRGLGTRETESSDWLSMIMFDPDYLEVLIKLGQTDAEKHGDEIAALLT